MTEIRVEKNIKKAWNLFTVIVEQRCFKATFVVATLKMQQRLTSFGSKLCDDADKLRQELDIMTLNTTADAESILWMKHIADELNIDSI